MDSNDTNKILHKELSYRLTGLLFKVHNELGMFCREKQYGDLLEQLLKEAKIEYGREVSLPIPGIDNRRTNIVDFIIDDKILLDMKAKEIVTKDDYFQMQRYLRFGGFKLGIIVNFHRQYLRPIRVLQASK